jgi:hypothetical protein
VLHTYQIIKLFLYFFVTVSQTFIISSPSRPDRFELTRSSVQRVPDALSVGVKRPEREVDLSCLSASIGVNSALSFSLSPSHIFIVWWLIKHTENFTVGTSQSVTVPCFMKGD